MHRRTMQNGSLPGWHASFADRLFVASKAVTTWQPRLARLAQGWVCGLSSGDSGYCGLRHGAAGLTDAGEAAVPNLPRSYVRPGGEVVHKSPEATSTSREGGGQITPPGPRYRVAGPEPNRVRPMKNEAAWIRAQH